MFNDITGGPGYPVYLVATNLWLMLKIMYIEVVMFFALWASYLMLSRPKSRQLNSNPYPRLHISGVPRYA